MTRQIDPLPGYVEPYGLLCAGLSDTTVEWRGEMPPELGPEVTTWRVRPGGQSIGAIMLHIINVEVGWLESFALRRPGDPDERALLMADELDVDEGRWPDPPHEPLSWYFDLHDRIRARTLESVKQWGPPEVLLESENRPTRSLPWVLNHVIQHEAYHGGQIVLLHDLWASQREGNA